MNQQEQQMIDSLVLRVQNAPLTDKDPQAEQYLQQSLGRNPDALYILAQTVLVQGYALEQAQKQLVNLKSQLQQQQTPVKHASFLGSIFGTEPDRPATPPAQPVYTSVPTYSQPQSYPQSYPPAGTYQQVPPASAGGGGFLRGAMQTAAGVAAGAVAFEGIESLMHGFGGHSGGSGFGGFGGDAPREEIVNNYYGDDSGREHNHDERGFLGNDDIEDRRDDASAKQDTFADADDSNEDAGADDFASSDADDANDTSGDDSSFS